MGLFGERLATSCTHHSITYCIESPHSAGAYPESTVIRRNPPPFFGYILSPITTQYISYVTLEKHSIVMIDTNH